MLAEGLGPADQRELDRLEADIREYIAQGRLRLNSRGRAALDAGKLPNLARSRAGGLDVQSLFASREVDVMAAEHYLTLDALWAKRFERFARLHHDWDRRTVALFVGPLGNARTTDVRAQASARN